MILYHLMTELIRTDGEQRVSDDEKEKRADVNQTTKTKDCISSIKLASSMCLV
jgi:hypothetical protein